MIFLPVRKNVRFILFYFIFLSGCSQKFSPCDNETIKIADSPNKVVSAFIIKKQCGATTSDAYHVYISKDTVSHNKKNIVFISDKVENLNIQWMSDTELNIAFSQARIFKFVDVLKYKGENYTVTKDMVIKTLDRH